MFLVLYAIVRKMVTIDISWKNIVTYVFASAVMSTFLFIEPSNKDIFDSDCDSNRRNYLSGVVDGN